MSHMNKSDPIEKLHLKFLQSNIGGANTNGQNSLKHIILPHRR